MSENPGVPPLRPLDLLAVLNEHDVDYVVIGGFALLAHDVMRATKDVDIVPDPAPENLDRLWDALVELGTTPLPMADFEPKDMPLDWEREALDHGGNWLLRTQLGRLDILQYVSGVDGYEQLRPNAVDVETDIAGRIWMAGREDLVAMKWAARRDRDLDDILRLKTDDPRDADWRE